MSADNWKLPLSKSPTKREGRTRMGENSFPKVPYTLSQEPERRCCHRNDSQREENMGRYPTPVIFIQQARAGGRGTPQRRPLQLVVADLAVRLNCGTSVCRLRTADLRRGHIEVRIR